MTILHWAELSPIRPCAFINAEATARCGAEANHDNSAPSK